MVAASLDRAATRVNDTKGVSSMGAVRSGGQPAPLSLPEWLVTTARHRPDHLALIDPDETLTYADLLERMHGSAQALLDAGLQRGEPVCFAMTPSADYLVKILGCLLAGGVAAPVNTRLTPTEACAYIARLEAGLVVSDPEHTATVGGAGDDGAQPEPRVVMSGPDLPPTREGVSVDGLLGGLTEDAPAIIFPTGGTTGLPKGAYTDHRGLHLWTWNIAQGSRRHRNEVELYFSPFFHVSLMVGMMAPLFAGGTVVIEPTFDVDRTIDAIRKHQVTRLMGAPTMFAAIGARRDTDRDALEMIRDIICGAAASTEEFTTQLMKDFPNAQIGTGYGATEFASGVSRVEDADLRRGRLDGVGLPNVGCEIRIVDDEGEPVEPGEVGHILVRSPWQTLGYWKQPDETAATYREDGFIDLGDLGKFDKTGWLYISGRSKEMILSGGENIFPIEVENAINAEPGVVEVVAFGVQDDHWGERVEAVVTAAEGTVLDPEALRNSVRDRLAGYKIPKRIHVVDSIPLTPNNKPDRRALILQYSTQ